MVRVGTIRVVARTNAPVSTRRDEILLEAATLFARRGIAATTVREIGDAVGLLSGSLYHHFASKEQMVDEIIASYLEDLVRRYRAVQEMYQHDPLECLRALIRASFESVAAHPQACEIYQNDFNYLTTLPRFAYIKRVSRNAQRIWMGTLVSGAEQGVFRADVDPLVFYRFLRDAIWMSVRWHQRGADYSVDTLSAECIAVFVEGYASGD
jgi:AcrR family transcriptional regulator